MYLGDGMALSRVRSLLGLHLAAFNPKSIMVSISSLQETNRLRKQNTKLPLYSLPTQSKTNRKRQLTSINEPTPCIKILKTTTKPKQKKRALSTINVDCDSLAKSHIMVIIITTEMNRCGHLNSIQLMSSGSIMHVQLLVFSL